MFLVQTTLKFLQNQNLSGLPDLSVISLIPLLIVLSVISSYVALVERMTELETLLRTMENYPAIQVLVDGVRQISLASVSLATLSHP